MKQNLQERLQYTYLRPLLGVKNISWRDHQIKEQIYVEILTSAIMKSEMHVYRLSQQSPKPTCSNTGGQLLNYMDTIARGLQQLVEDLPNR